MLKPILAVLALTGLMFGPVTPASALTAGAIVKPAANDAKSGIVQAGWRHHHHRGLSIGFGWGYPRSYGYPRYRYSDDYSYYRPRYYRPSYSYYAPVRNRHRHWCNRHDRWEW